MKTINRSLKLASFPFWMSSFLLPIYCSSLGLSPLETTGMFSVYSLFVLLSKLVSGRLCDHEKIGRKKVFLTGLVLTACSYALLAFSRELVWLYLSQMIDGIATALLSVSLYTMVVDESGEEIAVNRGKQSAAQNFGGLYGMIFYFVLLSNMDFFATWKVFFLGSAVLTLYGVWNAARKLEDNMSKETDGKKLQNLKLAICLKAKGLIAVRFLLSLSLNVLGAVFVLIMMQRFGNNMMMIGLICLIPSTLLAYLSPSIGAKIKRFGERKSFLTASILAILLLIWMSASTVPVLFGLGWSGYSFTVTAMNLSMDAVFSKQIPEKERGRYSGIYSCSVNLGSMIAAVLGGFFMQEIGESTPFYLTAVLLILTMLVFQKVLLTENK